MFKVDNIVPKLFGEAQSKSMKAYAQSGQYHTTVESVDNIVLLWRVVFV